jgi:ferredoxin
VKVADCVGCGRCVSSCPTQALEFKDVRRYIRPFARNIAKRLSGVSAEMKVATRVTQPDLELP